MGKGNTPFLRSRLHGPAGRPGSDGPDGSDAVADLPGHGGVVHGIQVDPIHSRGDQVGDLVEIPGTRRQAEVTDVKDGTLTLKAGVLQMKVKAGEVRLIEAAERAANQ